MNKQSYTPQEIQGKWIACSVLLDPPSLDAVTHNKGINQGLPVLYNSVDDAKDDKFFADDWDKVISADEYFKRIETENFKF